MKCRKCKEYNDDCRKTCTRCGSYLEGYTVNNVTGQYGYRGGDGYFYHSWEDYEKRKKRIESSSHIPASNFEFKAMFIDSKRRRLLYWRNSPSWLTRLWIKWRYKCDYEWIDGKFMLLFSLLIQ